MTTRQTVTIQSPEDRQRIANWARNVDLGTIVEFRKKTRSHEQNAKLHAMLGEVSSQVVWYGQKLKVEDWKNMFSASLRKAQVVPGIDPGTVVPLGIHTSTMTIDEMSNMIELIYHFGAQPEHPVTFKDPNTEDSEAPPPRASDEDDAPRPVASSCEPEGSPAPSPSGSQSDSEPNQVPVLRGRAAAPQGLRSEGSRRRGGDNDTPAKDAAISRLVLNYGAIFESKDARSAMQAMAKPIAAVINGKRSREAAAHYIATDLLGCDVADLEEFRRG